jgi:hypothetical protein
MSLLSCLITFSAVAMSQSSNLPKSYATYATSSIGLDDAVPDMKGCWLVFKQYVERHVKPENMVFIFSRITTLDDIDPDNHATPFHCSLILDRVSEEVYIYLQVGECKASEISRISSDKLPIGFFEDSISPSVFNYEASAEGCPYYSARRNNSHVLYTGIKRKYNVEDLGPVKLCAGPWAGEPAACDPSMFFQPVNVPRSGPYFLNSINDFTIAITILYSCVYAIRICFSCQQRRNGANLQTV